MITAIIGITAQIFYSARVIIQWIETEKSHHIESPGLFWICSLFGSLLLFCYGWLRYDFAIILGELFSYYIYIWNLRVKGIIVKLPNWLIRLLYLFPLILIFFVVKDFNEFTESFLNRNDLPLQMVVWGSLGQIIFKSRFVYQWYYCKDKKVSILPIGFWWTALIGSFIIISYALYRKDWILLTGQFSIFASLRNLIIGYHSNKGKL